jgi:hypothetical protein
MNKKEREAQIHHTLIHYLDPIDERKAQIHHTCIQ